MRLRKWVLRQVSDPSEASPLAPGEVVVAPPPPPGLIVTLPPPQAPVAAAPNPQRLLVRRLGFYATCLIVYLAIVWCGCRLASIGIDARWDFWAYWAPNRYTWDINNALRQGRAALRDARELGKTEHAQHPNAPAVDLLAPGPSLLDRPITLHDELQRWRALAPSYGLIYRGWVRHYELLQHNIAGDYELDYPPLRLMVMTLWAWRVQSEFPGLDEFPASPRWVRDARGGHRQLLSPDIAAPLLTFNLLCDTASAACVFFLTWLWANRLPKRRNTLRELTAGAESWRDRWGDPLLLVPALLLGVMLLVRPLVGWDFVGVTISNSLIDARVSSAGWWLFVVMRFVAAVSLARLLPRPFRGPACGLVAAGLLWLNPAGILESFGWPQWECWLPPFFLASALLVSLNWWMAAGVAIGVGCMFKGQLLFVSPVLMLAPLLCGWPWRFVRMVAGVALGAALVVWPWLIQSGKAEAYVAAVAFAVVVASWPMVISPAPRRVWRWQDWRGVAIQLRGRDWRHGLWIIWLATSVTAGWLVLMALPRQNVGLKVCSFALAVAMLIGPWFLRRRWAVSWVLICFTAGIWLANFSLGGNSSWWNVGFMYGTQKHQQMQLGEHALSNLSSILSQRYHWDLHDPVAVVQLPFGNADGVQLDIQSLLAVLYGLTLILCAAAAAVHLRRRDPRFLVAVVAPWVLFVTLLSQMASRYTILPALMASCFVAVSVSMSLMQLLLTVLACMMVGNQLMSRSPEIAPRAYAIGSATYPDMGWMMLLLAGVMLVSAMTPSNVRRQ